MILKCHLKGMNCPRYFHEGPFLADNQTFKQFEPDLQRCANCIAYEQPQLPDFRDDLIQIGAMTLMEKGQLYQADHDSGASFGSFIRPCICGDLRDARKKELKQRRRCLLLDSEEADGMLLRNFSDPHTAFENKLLWEMRLSEFEKVLPELLLRLAPNERKVFRLLRAGRKQRDIAKALSLSPARISQISKKVVQKLNRGCQALGIIERAPTDTQ